MKKIKNKLINSVLRNSFLFLFGFLLVASIPFSFISAESGTNSVAESTPGIRLKTHIKNPIGKADNLQMLISAGLELVVKVGFPIVVLAIIYSGFLFISAQGNKDKLVKAKNTLLTTLIGAVILLGAHFIARAIGKTVLEMTQSVSFHY